MPLCCSEQYDPALKRGRERSWFLVAAALNFTHKITCAVIFGVFGLLVSLSGCGASDDDSCDAESCDADSSFWGGKLASPRKVAPALASCLDTPGAKVIADDVAQDCLSRQKKAWIPLHASEQILVIFVHIIPINKS